MNELSDDSKSVLDAARAHRGGPSPAQRLRMRHALVATVASSTAVAAASSMSVGKLVLAGVLSAAVGASMVVGVRQLTSSSTKPRPERPIAKPPAQATPLAPTVAAQPPAAAAPLPKAPPTPTVRVAPPQPASAPVVQQTPDQRVETPRVVAPDEMPTAGAPSKLRDDVSLTAEVRAVSVAMAATDAKRWAEALSALDGYHREFPNGALATEATVLEITALCALDRAGEAESRAKQLLARDGANPAVQRLRSTCVGLK